MPRSRARSRRRRRSARRAARRGRPPGVVRTSTHTDAPAGITFICAGSPARSTVGVIHTCPRCGCSPMALLQRRAPARRGRRSPADGPVRVAPLERHRPVGHLAGEVEAQRAGRPWRRGRSRRPRARSRSPRRRRRCGPRATRSLAPSIIPSSSTSAASTMRPGNGPLRRERVGGEEHRRQPALHVGRAATPQPAVDDLAAERVDGPARRPR